MNPRLQDGVGFIQTEGTHQRAALFDFVLLLRGFLRLPLHVARAVRRPASGA
jgi:hypothetical protein